MKILLTGSNGFLGRYLYDSLQQNGHKVKGMDIKGDPDLNISFTSANLHHKLKSRDADDIELVIHNGAQADVYRAAKDPIGAYYSNIFGTHYITKLCNEMSIPIIYISTWEVYGEPKYQPLDEMHPTNPDHPYNLSKLAAELIVQNRIYPADNVILRLGTLYGAGVRDAMVIPTFIRMAKNNEDITIHGTGEQFRQFTHVSDICSAVNLAIDKSLRGIYNVIADEKVAINDIVEGIGEFMPLPNITHEDARAGDIQSAQVSADKLKVEGWDAKIKFINGLKEIIDDLS